MKKRKMGIFLISAAMLLGVGVVATSCESKPQEQVAVKNIQSVTIKNLDETTVLDGSIINLSATVTPIDSTKEYNKKVTWASSDETVATVKNGAVTLKKVTEDKTVTITATSVEDDTKSGSVTLTVKHSVIDMYASKGNNLDSSMYLEDGSMSVAPGDVALISADAYGTKFYFESEIRMDEIAETENYPKVGLMIGDNPDGNWAGQGDGIQSLFFYLDAIKGNLGAGITTYGVVTTDEAGGNWAWGAKPIDDFKAGKSVKLNTSFKMGILRNGTQYIVYVENAETGKMEAIKTFTWNGIAADKDAYVWVGGFNTGMTCKGFTGVKDNIDNYFAAPTKITLNGDQTLFVGDSYRSEIKLDSNTYDFSKLTWTSSNPAVATVDGTGVVTATTTTGETTITATYGEISSSYKVTVTNDVAYKIVLDGNRDEEIWQVAKTKPIYLTRDGNNYEDFYAIKTGRGILIGADLYTKDQHIAGEWFKGDNFEFRLSVDGKIVDKQFWFSNGAGISNVKDTYVSSYTEERGLYKISFESLVAYSEISENASVDSVICFADILGANPGGSLWHEYGRGFSKEITTEGIKDVVAHDCSAGHDYKTSTVLKPATCVEDGTGVEYCRYCGDRHEFTIPKGAHEAREGTTTTKVEPTETTFGEYEAVCDICEETFSWEGDRSKNLLAEPIAHNHNVGGWGDANIWSKLFVEEGDFKYEVKAHMEGGGTKADENYNAPDNCWKTLLAVVYGLKEDGSPDDPAVFRMDWFGWMDDWSGDGVVIAESQEKGGTWCDWGSEIATAVKDAEVTYTFVRTGNDLCITTTIHSNTYDKTFPTMTQYLRGINRAKIGVALSSEFTVAQINGLWRMK